MDAIEKQFDDYAGAFEVLELVGLIFLVIIVVESVWDCLYVSLQSLLQAYQSLFLPDLRTVLDILLIQHFCLEDFLLEDRDYSWYSDKLDFQSGTSPSVISRTNLLPIFFYIIAQVKVFFPIFCNRRINCARGFVEQRFKIAIIANRTRNGTPYIQLLTGSSFSTINQFHSITLLGC